MAWKIELLNAENIAARSCATNLEEAYYLGNIDIQIRKPGSVFE
jgi:hypothetical protein